jgi:hypothetical protein
MRGPLQPCAHNAKVRKSSPLKSSAPRGLKKRRRRREEIEEDGDDEMLQTPPLDPEEMPLSFSTPKRQRRTPLAIPLGLSAADFRSLDSPRTDTVELDMPDPPSLNINIDADAAENGEDWTAADDRALVETVLEATAFEARVERLCQDTGEGQGLSREEVEDVGGRRGCRAEERRQEARSDGFRY